MSEAQVASTSVEAEEQELAFASQWRLMWMRFRRHRLALIGGVVLLVFYVLAAFCEFVSPYDPNQRHPEYVLCPPQEIRFFDDQGEFHLCFFVYGLREDPHSSVWEREYLLNTERRYTIHFFAAGFSYKMWNLFTAETHFFNVGTGPAFLFGTDDLGRDVFSRILYGV